MNGDAALQRLWYGPRWMSVPLWPLAWLFRAVGSIRRLVYRAGLLRAQPANVPLDVLTDAVIADVRTFEDGTDPTDDVTSLCLRYRG